MSTQDVAIRASTPAPGWGDLLSGKNAIYALALAGGVTLHAVNIYIVTTVLPSVVKDIGGLNYLAWSAGSRRHLRQETRRTPEPGDCR
jgi:hypothetical protein